MARPERDCWSQAFVRRFQLPDTCYAHVALVGLLAGAASDGGVKMERWYEHWLRRPANLNRQETISDLECLDKAEKHTFDPDELFI